MKKRHHFSISTVLGRAIVYLYALIVLIPLYFIIVTSLKTGSEITLNPLGFPEIAQFQNFIEAFKQGGLLRASWNSIYTSVLGVALQLLFVTVCSFCCHKLRNYKLGTILYTIILAGMFIPKAGFVTQITLYRDLGIYNTHWTIILGTAVSITFGVFIVAGFLRTIPYGLEEAAELDGCNDFQLLFHIMVPIIKPALVTVAIFSFCTVWNSLTGPLLFIRDKELYTIPMALLTFNSTHSTQYELLFAGILITGLPLVIVYSFCQKYFVQALAGSVKG